MKISRRKLIVLGGSVIASSALSMPAIASGKKIKVGALRFTSHSASFIAKERGYFKEAGLDVEFKFFQAAQPMAIAIAYGLILATLLTLVFLPAFLKIINKIRYTKEWIFTGKKLNHEDREPAIKELEYEKI